MNTSFNSISTTSILDNYLAVLKKYTDFEGRARRSEYWYFFLANVVVTQSWNLVNVFLFNGSTLVAGLIMLLNLIILVPSIAVAVRRMHDVGKSGWYALIPIYNLILACTEGTRGTNVYGTDPKLGVFTKANA